ncbi:MAG: prepilin-type N-terminal cleavage/methylation domain-containing protein [Clostridiaceae bacterium]
MKKAMTKLLNKMGVKKVKKLNNNKGFSLIELLIVIAIMGVLAAIAFNMFGGVLVNSKKRADDQQARNIEKAIMTYCVDSGDWKLTKGTVGAATTAGINLTDDDEMIKALLQEIKIDPNTYGPILSPKYPEDTSTTSGRNIDAYKPQWNTDNGGKYAGWKIDIYPDKQSVTVKPTTVPAECITTVHV